MKLTRKLFIGAAALLAAVSFAGCGESVGAEGIIKGSGKSYSVDYANESDSVARGIKFLATNHNDADVTVTYSEQTGGTAAGFSGVMGFVFGKETNADKSINFCVVSVRKNNKNNGAWDYYISAYRNIDESVLESENNFGATAVAKEADFLAATTPSEFEIVKLGTALNGVTAGEANGAGSVVIDVKQDTDTDSETFGGYRVDFYNVSDTEKATSLISSAEISAKVAGIDTEKDNTKLKIQRKIGVYTNVYASSSLKGAWKIGEITGEAEIEE